jgi:ligand-binding sensor protein
MPTQRFWTVPKTREGRSSNMPFDYQSQLKVEQIIDIDKFEQIQDILIQFTNSFLLIVRPDGTPIGNNGNSSALCKLVRKSKAGCERCVACCKEAGLAALRNKVPRSFKCYCGLWCCSAPIVVNDIYIGSALVGQVIMDEMGRESIDIERLSSEFGIPAPQLERAVSTLPVADLCHTQRLSFFLEFLVDYVADLGLRKLTHARFAHEIGEKMSLQKLANDLELKQMQAQMNPHFLFNALNTVARLAMLEAAPQTEKIIYELANYLRYSLKTTEGAQKLEREIENARRYLAIQKMRFGDRLEYQINIDPTLLDYTIPAMILQPIVENSVIHGLEIKKDGGKIMITGEKLSGEEMLISVSDNGVGFPPETLASLNNCEDPPPSNFGLGLVNTSKRIRGMFGERYGLRAESIPNETTTVYISLPLRL